MRVRILPLSLLLLAIIAFPAWAGGPQEIREYQGQKLSPFNRDYDNAIEQPLERQVKIRSYRLKVEGLVDKPLNLTYEQVLALPHHKRVVKMPCVEGWTETLLYEGVRLTDLFAKAKMKPGVTTVIFHTVGKRYSSSLSLAYVKKADVLLGFKINGLKLNQERGFPFQVVAPHKLGYKWVKWVERIELSDKPYKGFWERHGYSNDAIPGARSR
jgi:DMSO/TMAO reductase YedYZ molybdopterin-dependent catalytic subunit